VEVSLVHRCQRSVKTYLLTKQPEPKLIKKVFNILQTQFEYLSPKSNAAKGGKVVGEEFIGEYQTLMDQEFFNFVLYEVPWIVT
jgi:V-type H+-transporting ATPase subunit C